MDCIRVHPPLILPEPVTASGGADTVAGGDPAVRTATPNARRCHGWFHLPSRRCSCRVSYVQRVVPTVYLLVSSPAMIVVLPFGRATPATAVPPGASSPPVVDAGYLPVSKCGGNH
jgi:hypothetical protein